jgi:adenine-specific DNA-methyltransferase
LAADPTVAAKAKIAESLKAFRSGNVAANALTFFESLGYTSDKTHELEPNTSAGLLDLANRSDFLNPAKAHVDEWNTVDFLFQLTDEEVRNYGQASLEFDSTIDVGSEKHIESYIFFAVELKKNSYTRTELADITRETNRLFPMPALVLFKHGETLTLSIINRRIHKRDLARDVLEKVTLIKDINISNPHRGHIEILYDLALPQLIATHDVTNFVQLDDAWRKTLDTSLLNKRFYKELANWYFWALQHVEFPKQAGVTDDVNRATNVIRLITRLIFVWFLKERELVPEALFDRASLGELLKDVSPDKSTFYKAILQNLFFATLNTPMNDPNAPRVFRSETNGKRFNDQYMVHNQYRYQKIFSHPEHALEIFAGIPFLNGGLFECLDKREEVEGKLVETRIDCFSDLPKKQPTVPNKLFFGEEEQIDLNETYGTRGRRYAVRGLIDTLNRYKFTIAENTPIEEEVALDPELLGKVFENLLASYNPETGATARKQTGSFYTPREIVNYMVDESLIAYLETQLPDRKDENGDNLNNRLRQLFAYTDEPHEFSPEQVDQLIGAIDAVKILDPACGSGAFPMGILQRLVFILSKLDPNNAKWEQRQIQRVREAMRAADKIEDHKFRDNTLHDLEAQIANIEEAFARNQLDYGRKLFLIENCIYGVDIQPIAIQIAKLRFFISLIINQGIRNDADNLGIRPLPNLETKFVAANTLLTVEKPPQGVLQNESLRTVIDQKERELKSVRERHFTARTTKRKEKYRKEDARLRREIGDLLERDNWSPETTKRLVAWNPYDQNATADFFDSEWMFELRQGFHIVIGNPPYVLLQSLELEEKVLDWLLARYTSAQYKVDTYHLFIERGLSLLDSTGILSYITPNTFLKNKHTNKLRELLVKKTKLLSILMFYVRVFEEQAVDNVVFVCSRSASKDLVDHEIKVHDIRTRNFLDEVLQFRLYQQSAIRPSDYSFELDVTESAAKVIRRMEANTIPLGAICGAYFGIQTYDRTAFVASTQKKKSFKPVIDGGNIVRYRIKPSTEFIDFRPENIKSGGNSEIYAKERVVVRQIGKYPEGALSPPGLLTLNTIYNVYLKSGAADIRYVLGLINSKAVQFYWMAKFFDNKETFPKIKKQPILSLPIRLGTASEQASVVKLVDSIVNAKREDEGTETTKLEDEIDELVYRLYDLTAEEIATIKASL